MTQRATTPANMTRASETQAAVTPLRTRCGAPSSRRRVPSGRVTPRPGARRRSRRARLTRRGRVLLVLVVSALLLAAFSLGRFSADAGSTTPALQRVTVTPGETLWQVAVRTAPDNDPRVTVQRLMRLNHLSTPTLRAGESLLVPRG